jgi:dTDP-4-amino-4,6-dideoxygalactose transaminase/SAM-dependent methyltransferase
MTNSARSPLQRLYEAQQRDLDDAYQRVMQRGEFILGPEVRSFEQEFATYCGTDHCIGVGNGLDALTLILLALGIKEGDEVILPGNTFIATFLAISHVDAVAVPVDPRPSTFNIDPDLVQDRITDKTRAIIAVHLFGQPAEMARLSEIASTHGLKLIEDAAQAHGANYRGQRVGGLADAAAFSFYPIKNLGAFGDGGAVTTDDPALRDAMIQLRNYGSAHKHRHDVRGFNSRLDELQAAFLRVLLKSLDESNATRRLLARSYTEALAENAPPLELPGVASDCEPVWHQYVVRCDEREELQQHLASRQVHTMIHYPVPPHLQPAYVDAGPARIRAAPLPITERLSRTSLSLPIHPHLTGAEQARVVDALLTFHGRLASGTKTSAWRSGPKPQTRDTASSKRARIQRYEQRYLADEGFEAVLVTARQRLILELLQQRRPRRVVEVGCGADMLVRRARGQGLLGEQWIVVEPSRVFAQRARDAATEDNAIVVVEQFFEDAMSELLDVASGPVDLVLLSGILNEVRDPNLILGATRQILDDAGLVHVNVPNAFSLHRRLAKAMDLIPDVHAVSQRNVELAQFHVFDRESLRTIMCDGGFVPEDEGGHFLKPFTHEQMLSLRGLLTPAVLDGLWSLGRELPELASEIYVNARRGS